MFDGFMTAIRSGDLQQLIESPLSQVFLIVIALLLLLLAVVFSKDNEEQGMDTRRLTYSALAIAISFVLSRFKLFSMPQGGDVTPFSMLFIIAIGYFFGTRTGVLAGFVYGILQLTFGGQVIHPIQLLMDYPLAFGALGLSGLVANQRYGMIKGLILGSSARFLFHFVSGLVFFSSYTPSGWNVVVYSFWYNLSYILGEDILTMILLFVPVVSDGFKRVKKMAIRSHG